MDTITTIAYGPCAIAVLDGMAYPLTGATRKDGAVDIEGGIGTMVLSTAFDGMLTAPPAETAGPRSRG